MTSAQFRRVRDGLLTDPGQVSSLDQYRIDLLEFVAQQGLADGVAVQEVAPGCGLRAGSEWLVPVDERLPHRVILYLHGGGFFAGSPATGRPVAGWLAHRLGAPVLSVGYRLAPEHPYPAAAHDAQAGYEWLRSRGFAEHDIVLVGESAGANLVLGVLLRLRDAGSPPPAAAFLSSPVVDLSDRAEPVDPGQIHDPWFSSADLRTLVDRYLPIPDLARDPSVSPMFADHRGLPPLLLQYGGAEHLRDSLRRYATVLARDEVDAVIDERPDMFHCASALPGRFPEADAALERAAQFLLARLAPDRRTAISR